jgi:hypothetical protein
MTRQRVVRRRAAREGLCAFAIYFALSLLFFGRALAGHLGDRYIGGDADAPQFIWYLRWWPWAIAHHLNPFVPRMIWPPSGVNLAWAASIPLPSILAAPLSATLGVIPTFNLLCLMCPALAGWAAFLLCREASADFGPSLLGGMVFGFSSHLLGKAFGNLNDALVFPIPLAVWIALRWVNGRSSTRPFVAMLAALLVTQFLCFTELFATMTLAGGISWLLGLALLPEAMKVRLRAIVAPVAASYVMAILILSPYLYFVIAHPIRQAEIMPARAFAIDLLNLLVPTPLNELGKLVLARAIAHRFLAGLMESGGYLTPPLIIVAWLFARERWREPSGRWLIAMIGVFLLLALGPELQVWGRYTRVPLPWALLARLPLIQKALPTRMMLYVFLVLAVVTALWLSAVERGPAMKIAIAAVILLFMLPNLSAAYWTTDANIPEFFTRGLYRNYLPPGANVVIMPYGINGDSMLWQATSDMSFAMVEGWTGFPYIPADFENWPMIESFTWAAGLPDPALQLRAFAAANHVSAFIVAQHCACEWEPDYGDRQPSGWRRIAVTEGDRRRWRGWFATLGVAPLEVGGVTIYRVDPQTLLPGSPPSAMELRTRDARRRFDALLLAAARYVAAGHDPAQLSPLCAAQLGLLPSDWISDHQMVRDPAHAPMMNRMLLGRWDNGDLAVGLVGPWAALAPLVQQYRADAGLVRYIAIEPPYGILDQPPRDRPFLLVMTFTPKTIAHAATRAYPN